MMTRHWPKLCGLLLLALGAGASAQPSPHPGFVDLDRLAGLANAEVLVDVRLDGWLLGLARAAAAEADDEHAELLSGIDSIRVRIVRLDDPGLLDQAQALAQQLSTEGWEQFARVRRSSDYVQVLVKGSQDRIDGITVMAMEASDEAVFVNIAGRLDPADIARILGDKKLIRADLDLGP